MKTPILIMATCVAAITFTINPVHAQTKEGGGAGHSHFIEVPTTTEEIWKAVADQQTKLNAVVAKNDLGEAHDHAYAIRDLVRALPGMVPAASKVDTEKAAGEIAKLATAIDKSSAAGAQKATEADVKDLDAAVESLRVALDAK